MQDKIIIFLVCTVGIGFAFAMGYWNRYARPIDRSPAIDSLGTQVRVGDMIQWTDRATGYNKTKVSSMTTYRMIVSSIDERHWIMGQAYIVGGWGDWHQKEVDGYRTDYTVIQRNCSLQMRNDKLTAVCVKE
jgi:hypothetical protein